MDALVKTVVARNIERIRNGEQLIGPNRNEQFDEQLRGNIKLLTPRGGDLGALLARYAPIIKHESFEAERNGA